MKLDKSFSGFDSSSKLKDYLNFVDWTNVEVHEAEDSIIKSYLTGFYTLPDGELLNISISHCGDSTCNFSVYSDEYFFDFDGFEFDFAINLLSDLLQNSSSMDSFDECFEEACSSSNFVGDRDDDDDEDSYFDSDEDDYEN